MKRAVSAFSIHKIAWESRLGALLFPIWSACSSGDNPNSVHAAGDASASSTVPPSASGTAAPSMVTSFATLGPQGEVLGVGVVVPVKSFENIPASDPAFQSGVGIEMPVSVRDKTFIQLLRINWLSTGHGPAAYHAPHFDLHFYRGTMDEVSAISCSDTSPFSPELLATGYETPTTCVTGMGYHAWPSADIESNTFSASIILGYAAQKMVFIEPMITLDRLVMRESFELAITRPVSASGTTTLYPAHLTATYVAESDTYTFEFNQFAPID